MQCFPFVYSLFDVNIYEEFFENFTCHRNEILSFHIHQNQIIKFCLIFHYFGLWSQLIWYKYLFQIAWQLIKSVTPM